MVSPHQWGTLGFQVYVNVITGEESDTAERSNL